MAILSSYFQYIFKDGKIVYIYFYGIKAIVRSYQYSIDRGELLIEVKKADIYVS